MSILIIGGGLAGLFTALKLAPLPCTVLTPTSLGFGASSAWAQGGVAAAIGEGDSIESHVADTLKAGAGLCDAAMVRLMASEASERILDLLTFGVPFDRDLEGKLVQSREAAHSSNRVVRVRGDMAGAKIMEALIAAVRLSSSIRVVEGAEATELIRDDHGAITGVRAVLHGRLVHLGADRVVLATGGAGQLFAVTTNPREAWGSGLAMGLRAGATLLNPEFVQFHPTALDIGRDPAPLATEALRGEGATLVDREGRRFMHDLHPDAELAPRDIVARGVFASIKAGRGAFLDCRRAIGVHFADLFPTVHATCVAAGIDPVVDLIPIAPAAHYHMGGLKVDADGAAFGVSGLYAVGEVAHTGVHGANRLASNSLLEAVVFGARVADSLARSLVKADDVTIHDEGITPISPSDDARQIAEIRAIMQRECGVVREPDGLRAAQLALAERIARNGASRAGQMAGLAHTMVHAATLRTESRGGHFRPDCPNLWAVARWTEICGDEPPTFTLKPEGV
ncbi:NadB Aspartate oxidase [Rhabdaerophilaceae bacterium]